MEFEFTQKILCELAYCWRSLLQKKGGGLSKNQKKKSGHLLFWWPILQKKEKYLTPPPSHTPRVTWIFSRRDPREIWKRVHSHFLAVRWWTHGLLSIYTVVHARQNVEITNKRTTHTHNMEGRISLPSVGCSRRRSGRQNDDETQ